CSPADGGAVTCAAREVKVNLEGGDDRAVVDPRVLGPVDGGPGADRLRGTWLWGGAGDDQLVAEDHVIQLDGGPGDDVLDGTHAVHSPPDAGPRGNRYGGGPGRDRVIGGPLREELTGGRGPDVVSGGDGADYILGGGDGRSANDDDVLDGGPGPDEIRGGDGDDRIAGGPGADYIDVADGGSFNASPLVPLGGGDQVSCGLDVDYVRGDYYDGIGMDCEHADRRSEEWRGLRPLRGRQFVVKVRCAWDYSRPCRGAAQLVGWPPRELELPAVSPALPSVMPPPGCARAPGAVIAHGRFEIRAGRVNRAALDLTPSGARLLARRPCIAAVLALRYADPRGGSGEMIRTIGVYR
ncbi:MAG: hypothetical protein QOJ12_2544, partial [Thermoleophilales bacterium]|nr:hypothetical protein [Thermoleophilales bacterium]